MKSFDERFEQAEFVFAAEVVATQLMVPADAKYRFSTDRVDISIGPAKSYKGDPSKLEALHTYADGASCGAGLTAGKTYTFFVKSDGLVLLCGGVVQDREWPEFWQWLTERGLE